MPGIQNRQSTLDFLDTLGTADRGDGIVMNASAKALVALGKFLIETASDNLEKKGNVASGDTISSMKIVNLDVKSVIMSLEVEILKTYKFLDEGVKGTKGGNGRYAFKNDLPSRKMVKAIEKWLRKRGKSGKIKYRGVSRNERKNKQINRLNESNNIHSLAYAVARSIKQHGIKKTSFFSNAIRTTQKLQKKMYAEAFRIDIINSLNKN